MLSLPRSSQAFVCHPLQEESLQQAPKVLDSRQRHASSAKAQIPPTAVGKTESRGKAPKIVDFSGSRSGGMGGWRKEGAAFGVTAGKGRVFG